MSNGEITTLLATQLLVGDHSKTKEPGKPETPYRESANYLNLP